MAEIYDLAKIMGEIIEDERISLVKNRKVTQEEIKALLLQKKRLAAKTQDSTSKLPLGEALIREGLLTHAQLEHALKVQAKKGQKIGSILIELGYIKDESLLRFLGKQYGTEGANLLEVCINEDIMSVLPSNIILKYRVLPLKVEERSIELAMESPNDFTAIREVEFFTSKRVNPVIVPSYQMDLAIRFIEEKGQRTFSGADIQRAVQVGPMTLTNLLQQLVLSNGSDLLLTSGLPPSIKMGNNLSRTNMSELTPNQCVAYAKALMNERQWEDFLVNKEVDFALDYEDIGRFRVNVYRQKDTVSLAIRHIVTKVQSFEALGLPDWLEDLVLKPQGLILITAPAGHGKTTTVSALINRINEKRSCNIITLEDPIEYRHRPVKSNINQREVGADTKSFSEGLRRIFRQAPDVIFIGELRDHETIEIALRAALTGHLVLSTMHASTTTAAIDSLVNRFPQHLQGQVRQQLADALLLVFAQRLIPTQEGDARMLAYEKLISTHSMRNFIREDKVHQIRSQTQAESDDFSSLDVCLVRLLKEDKITMNSALLYAENTDYVAKLGE